MAENGLDELRKDLNFKKLQLNSIYEISSVLHSSSGIDDILRIFFSIVMGPMGISRAFFFDRATGALHKKGFHLTPDEASLIKRSGYRAVAPFTCVNVSDLNDDARPLRELLQSKKVYSLINISQSKKKRVILGLGQKFNSLELSGEDQEFVCFLSRFALIALDNARYIEQAIEKKRIEHELSIAREIQLSLLPQRIPPSARYDIGVVYVPIQDVGGDYYDILQKKKNLLPLVLADVEGKGLSAALLAAAAQAVFQTLNELYLFQPGKFIAKANSLILKMTRGTRFITLLWMLLDDVNPGLTYVNAGHPGPYLISGQKIQKLGKSGLLLGFSEKADYEEETIRLKSGDMIVAFTDGVNEVENPAGEEFGECGIIRFIQSHRGQTADKICSGLYRKIKNFSKNRKFRDDFTILIVKVK
jgi:sigma-B regulation protein RsbU (phosphoserine phosphatase)